MCIRDRVSTYRLKDLQSTLKGSETILFMYNEEKRKLFKIKTVSHRKDFIINKAKRTFI